MSSSSSESEDSTGSSHVDETATNTTSTISKSVPKPKTNKNSAQTTTTSVTELVLTERYADDPEARGHLAMSVKADHDNKRRGKFCPEEATMLCDIKSWIIDTGSGLHLVDRKCVIKHADKIRKFVTPMQLQTANGTIKAEEQILIRLGKLQGEAIMATILENSPAVISVGLLCREQRYTFHWEGFGRPYLDTPDKSKELQN